jgi:type IV pilus assembly protein PilQ
MRKFIAIALSALMMQLQVPLLWAADEAYVESVQVGKNSVTVNTDKPVQYETFTSAEPARIVLELLGTRIKGDDKKMDGSPDSRIQSVRAEQYEKTPLSITHIVLQLAQKAAYSVVADGNSVKVELDGSDSAAPAVQTQTAAPKTPRMEVSASAAAASAQPSAKGDYVDILANMPRDPVTLDYDLADIRDVLSMLGARIGVNMVYADDVGGDVTLRLDKVPFNEAFATILATRSLTATQKGSNILYINTQQSLAAEKTASVMATRAFTLNYIKAVDAQTVIAGVIKAEGRSGAVTVDVNNNMLLVTDIPSGLDSEARIIGQIDKKPQQVLIETKFVEVNLTDVSSLGVSWAYSTPNAINTTTGRMVDGTNIGQMSAVAYKDPSGNTDYYGSPMSSQSGGTGVSYPTISNDLTVGAFNLGYILNGNFLSMTLNAAVENGKAKVLSEPKVLTFNNNEAKMNVTTQIPYTTTTTTTSSGNVVQNTTVVYITTGISLDVTPRVDADGRITMKLSPSVSQVSSTVAEATGGAPGVDTRSADTIVMTKDGETIVIGGLIYDNNDDVLYKVPLLGDIPLLGWLFKKHVTNRQRMELLIFVTPHLVED